VRYRYIAAIGWAIVLPTALLSLTACRSSPDVAAYVGDTKITEARVTQVTDAYNTFIDKFNKDNAESQPRPHVDRPVVVQYLVHDELCNRLSKEKGFTFTPGSLPNEAPELAVLATRTEACIKAIPAPDLKPSDAEYRALYDRAISAGLIPPGTAFDSVVQQWQGDADLNALLGREKALSGVASVKINPRYGQLSVLGLNPAVAAPLEAGSGVVEDRPPSAPPQQQ
jgi:hypothetical protein